MQYQRERERVREKARDRNQEGKERKHGGTETEKGTEKEMHRKEGEKKKVLQEVTNGLINKDKNKR